MANLIVGFKIKYSFISLHSIFLLLLFFFFFYTATAAAAAAASYSQSIIKTLPGFNGDLPFKLETGYIGVGKNDEMQLFYYFIKSERDPENDPLVLSLIGGPGCSSLSTIVDEFGPITFDPTTFGSSLPSLVLNPHSWTKVANIIFLDWPAFSGFSYATNPDAYNTSDSSSPKDIYTFLRKWLLNHPAFMKNPLYIGGDSYAGKIAPIIAWEIAKANEAGFIPRMTLQGYFVGNPITDAHLVVNDRVQYAYNMALISDQHLKLAESSCGKEYVNVDVNNVQCHYALQLIDKCLEDIVNAFILGPACPKTDSVRSILEDDSNGIILPSAKTKVVCQDQLYLLSETWANNPVVRKALGVREGTTGKWIRCNKAKTYDADITSSAKYHRFLIEKGYRGLVYSGDHDLKAPYTSTMKWIRSLNLTLDETWRPWKLDYHVAGYTERYVLDGAYLTFATVKGSGHTVATYTPEEAFAMISRWLSDKPL